MMNDDDTILPIDDDTVDEDDTLLPGDEIVLNDDPEVGVVPDEDVDELDGMRIEGEEEADPLV